MSIRLVAFAAGVAIGAVRTLGRPRHATVHILPERDPVTDPSSEPLEPGELIDFERRKKRQ